MSIANALTPADRQTVEAMRMSGFSWRDLLGQGGTPEKNASGYAMDDPAREADVEQQAVLAVEDPLAAEEKPEVGLSPMELEARIEGGQVTSARAQGFQGGAADEAAQYLEAIKGADVTPEDLMSLSSPLTELAELRERANEMTQGA